MSGIAASVAVSGIAASVVRVLLAVGTSIVAVLLLLPVALLIAAIIHRIVGGGPVGWVGSLLSLDTLSGDVGERVEMAIIGGLIGGIVFVGLTPAIAPTMYDFHVQSGVVDRPEPAVSVHEIRGVDDTRIAEGFHVPADGNYSLYVVELTNDDQRTLRDYNFNVRFPGCVETTAMGATNFGAAVVSNESDRVHLGEFANRSANATCYGAVEVDEFPPGNALLATVVVDESAESDQRRLYPAPDGDGVLTTSSYTWEYNSRSYHEPAELTGVDVTVHNATRA